MTYSSRSLVTVIRVPVAPSSSSRPRAVADSSARSPESIRIAPRSVPGDLDRGADALRGVVGVHEERRADALRGDLAAERVGLAGVGEGEGVGGGADGGDAVQRGRRRGCWWRRSPATYAARADCHRGLLVGAAAAHLDERPPLRPPAAVTIRAAALGDRAVVVEHAQDQRLEHHALAERAGDGEDRAAGEVEVALGVGVDVAGEAEVAQVGGGGVVDHPLAGSQSTSSASKVKSRDHRQQAAEAGEHAVAPALGQSTREGLEDRRVIDAAVGDERGEHGEFVAVGQQAGRGDVVGDASFPPCCSQLDYNTSVRREFTA